MLQPFGGRWDGAALLLLFKRESLCFFSVHIYVYTRGEDFSLGVCLRNERGDFPKVFLRRISICFPMMDLFFSQAVGRVCLTNVESVIFFWSLVLNAGIFFKAIFVVFFFFVFYYWVLQYFKCELLLRMNGWVFHHCYLWFYREVWGVWNIDRLSEPAVTHKSKLPSSIPASRSGVLTPSINIDLLN